MNAARHRMKFNVWVCLDLIPKKGGNPLYFWEGEKIWVSFGSKKEATAYKKRRRSTTLLIVKIRINVADF